MLKLRGFLFVQLWMVSPVFMVHPPPQSWKEETGAGLLGSALCPPQALYTQEVPYRCGQRLFKPPPFSKWRGFPVHAVLVSPLSELMSQAFFCQTN